MSKSNQNIDETFRDAFQNWEADYSVSEMNADWDAFSKKIPQAPQQPAAKPDVGNNPAGLGMGTAKILGLTTAAGIIITAASILLYNSNNENKSADKILTETTEVIATEKTSEGNKKEATAEINNNNKSEEVNNNNPVIVERENKNNTDILSKTANRNTKNESAGSATNVNSNSNQVQTATNNSGNSSANQTNAIKSGNDNNDNATVIAKPRKTVEYTDTVICNSQPLVIANPERGSEMRIEWGDGKKVVSSKATYIYMYEKPGTYTLRIESKNEVSNRRITVKPSPVAHFSNTQSNGLTCKFKNFSEGANGYLWYFGDKTYPATSYHAEHTFQDTGKFMVKLIAFNSGCTDTLIQAVYVSNRNNFNLPNVITPNGDGSNDVFDARINEAILYEITIMDRSGQIVFQSTDKNSIWEGKNQQNGSPCQPGTYIYNLRYQFPGENINSRSGIITLIR